MSAAEEILETFARETGLTSDRAPRRYLWTDAHACCAWLGLSRRTGEARHLERTRTLVEQVHGVLGRHRPDDPRSGWISGLDDEEGARHPTAAGLRIGKELPERRPGEPMDRRLEWDRDGQYFHYLTRWMHALLRVWEDTGDARYLRQGLELAGAAFRGFVRNSGGGGAGRPRIIWKASIDLSRPLVDSQGHHDPLDGWITFRSLQAARREVAEGAGASRSGRAGGAGEASAGRSEGAGLPDLQEELDRLEPLVREGDREGEWATHDALGIGGLLGSLCRVLALERRGHPTLPDLPGRLCRDAARSLEALERQEPLRMPAEHRLPFRELGLSLGVRGVERIGGGEPLQDCLATLSASVPLAERIEAFWLDPDHRSASTWTEHLDINRASLAASLVPEGWFGG